MRNGVLLVLVAGAAVVNGLHLDHIPAWRQALFVVLAVAAYLHGRHLPAPRGWLLLAGIALATAGYATADTTPAVDALLSLGLFVTLPWLAGRFRRQQAALVRAGTERVAHLERERRFVAEHARLLERARIAADMHDALGHDLALLALRAGALELATDMTDTNRSAAAELRACAVATADRLRHTVTGLRTTPDPAATSLDALVDRARTAGMTIRLHGNAGLAPSAATERALHRVVQEALTNAARHADGSTVDIHLDRQGETIALIVTNPLTQPAGGGHPGAGSLALSSGGETPVVQSATSLGGSGIAGLRDHVEGLGGTLHAQRGEREFTVTVRLPADARIGVEPT